MTGWSLRHPWPTNTSRSLFCFVARPSKDPTKGQQLVPSLGNPPTWMELRATRKPTLLFRLDGSLLFRIADRQFSAELFHEPPRTTRFVPLSCSPLNLVTHPDDIANSWILRQQRKPRATRHAADRRPRSKVPNDRRHPGNPSFGENAGGFAHSV